MAAAAFSVCAEPLYAASSSVCSGVFYGQIEEIVYKGSEYRFPNEKLSQLLWDMKPLAFWGVSLNLERRKPLDGFGFFTSAALKYGIAADSGVMEDRDWLEPVNGYEYARDGRLTNYSQHTNRTQNALIVNLDAGVSLPLFKALVFKAYATALFMDFSFESRDGYYQYVAADSPAVWSDSLAKVPFSGPAINYKQMWVIGGLGVSLALPLDFFRIALAFSASPLISCAAHDSHLARQMEFYDYVDGGFFLEPKAELSFSLPHVTFSAFYAYKYAALAKGLTYEKVSDYYFQSGSAGAGFAFMEVGVSVKLLLGARRKPEQTVFQ